MICKINHSKQFDVFSCSFRGEMHRQLNLPNQDSVTYFTSKGGDFFGVADGLGSCKKSHIGSRRLLKIGIELIKDIGREKIVFSEAVLIREFISRWKKLYPSEGLGAYSTTLKAVFVHRQEMIALSCGDGLLLIYDGKEMREVGDSDEGGFVNETLCFGGNIVPTNVKSIKIKCPAQFMLFMCTDGISLALDDGKKYDFLKTLFESGPYPELTADMTDFVREIATCNFDDKTLEVVYHAIKRSS